VPDFNDLARWSPSPSNVAGAVLVPAGGPETSAKGGGGPQLVAYTVQ
jgi:hypothetical protein